MNEALEAINDEAMRLMDLVDDPNSELMKGLDLIRALAQYKTDIRARDDMEKHAARGGA